MGQEKKAESASKQYLYKDEEMRLKRSNRLVLLSSAIMLLIIIFYLTLRIIWKETDQLMLQGIAIGVAVLALVMNVVTYKVESLRRKFRVTNAFSIGIVYLTVMFLTDATFVYWLLAAILLMNIPYFDRKYVNVLAVFFWLSYIVSVLYRQMAGVLESSADMYALFITIIAVIFLACMTSKILNIFMNDMTGYMQFQQSQQEVMVNDVLNTSKVVKDETDKSTEYMAELYASAESIHRSM